MKKQRNIKKQKKNGRQLQTHHSHQHHDVHISNDNNTASSCVRKKRKKNKGKSLDGRVSEHGDTAMDDILAQLQRQREKRKQQQTKEDQTSSAAAASIQVPQHHDDTSTTSNIASSKQTQKTNVLSGKYHYDPTTKRYYPRSTLKSNGNNDVCIQRIQEKKQMLQDNMGCKVDGPIKSNNDNMEDGFFYHGGAVTDEDVRRVIFRGTCLMSNICKNGGEDMSTITLDGKRNPSKKKQRRHNNVNHLPTETKTVERRRIPCTERTSLLLSTSLQYCTNIQKRKAVSSVLGPMSVARKAKIVSTSSTLEDVKRNTKQYNMQSYYSIDRQDEGLETLLQPFATTICKSSTSASCRWFSMLCPLKVGPQDIIQKQVPYDCICKSYLQPTSSTFDVLPNSCSTRGSMPHLATILNDSIFYRESRSIRGSLLSAWKVGR